jgi:hypothetical protein
MNQKRVCTEINKWLETNERNLVWLSVKSGISYSQLYFTLKTRERKLTERVVKKIGEAIDMNFIKQVN